VVRRRMWDIAIGQGLQTHGLGASLSARKLVDHFRKPVVSPTRDKLVEILFLVFGYPFGFPFVFGYMLLFGALHFVKECWHGAVPSLSS